MNSRIVLIGSALAGWTVLALLDAAAKAGILLGVTALAMCFMGKWSAASKHMVWLCALAAALVLPLGFALLPQWRILPSWMKWEEVPRLLAPETPMSVMADTAMDEARFTTSDETGTFTPVRLQQPVETVPMPLAPEMLRISAAGIITIWAIGAGALFLPVMISGFSLRRRALFSREVSEGPLKDALEAVKNELGMKRRIILLIGRPDTMPMVWGIFRCRLLLPESAEEWSAKRRRTVLLHEISHLRRHDPLALLIAHLALSIHWFNPLAWHAVRRLRIEQENACDDSVLRHGIRPTDYAVEMLAAASSFRSPAFERFAAHTMARRAGIEARIAGILDGTKCRRSVTIRLASFSAVTLLCASFFLAILRAGEGPDPVRGRILDRNGIVLAESSDETIRNYPFGETAAHRLGYVAKNPEGTGYLGASGMELIHDELLARGEDIRLTLDVKIQEAAENVMRKAEVERGAVVVLDCRNGDLLANASFPSYDPNDFIPEFTMDRFRDLQSDVREPLRDRTVSPAAPGSIFKLVTALAGAHTGKADRIFECKGYESYDNHRLGCWIGNRDKGAHGNLDLHESLVRSCNCYSAQLANEIGLESMEKTANLLGFGKISGSRYPGEMPGIFPGPEAMTAIIPSFKATPAETAYAAIGQGPSLATPLQLAVLAATIGNGEKVWVPRLNVNDPPRFRTDLSEHGWNSSDLAKIRSAMHDSINRNGGTSPAARSSKVDISGKGATAIMTDSGRVSAAWFIAYAPADDPQFAVAVLVEDGFSGAQVCGPIARDLLEAIYGGGEKD